MLETVDAGCALCPSKLTSGVENKRLFDAWCADSCFDGVNGFREGDPRVNCIGKIVS